MSDNLETNAGGGKFDPTAYPPDTLFHERRDGQDRRARADDAPPADRRVRKERRRRIDPTTFEKQYTEAEIEFMNAMQRYKVQSGKAFPSHGDVLRVAVSLGYRRAVPIEPGDAAEED